MRRLIPLALAAALAGPALAVTSISPNAPEQRPGVAQGVVDLHLPSQLKVDGRTYQLSISALRVFDRNGRPVDGAHLAAGTRIAFATSQEGAATRITSIWILR